MQYENLFVPTNRKLDITKANNILNLNPKYDLESGFLKIIEYFSK
jgi:nucleoside-diphosphate-sugar epimerase